jgi:hypothetical protein
LPGVDVWRAWRAFVKLLVTVKSPVKKYHYICLWVWIMD